MSSHAVSESVHYQNFDYSTRTIRTQKKWRSSLDPPVGMSVMRRCHEELPTTPWDAACTLEELDPVLFITVDRIAWLDLKEDGAPVEPSSDFFGFGLRGALAWNRRARCPVLSWEGLP